MDVYNFNQATEDVEKSTTTQALQKKVQDRGDKMELWKNLWEIKKPQRTK